VFAVEGEAAREEEERMGRLERKKRWVGLGMGRVGSLGWVGFYIFILIII
jgi:hypothetical protein